MSATTRRGFLAGAAAGATLALPAAGDAAAPAIRPARREVVRRGRALAVSPDGRRLVVAHDRLRTVAVLERGGRRARLVDVGGQPVAVAVAPDGVTAAVTTGFWEEPGLAIVDLRAAALRLRRSLGPAPGEVAFTQDGGRLLVVGGEQEGTLHVLETERFRTVARAVPGRVPRGVAHVPGTHRAWVALNADDAVALVDVRSGRVLRERRTPPLPDRIALAPDGERLLVAHGGREADRVTELDLRSRRTHRHHAGRLPSGVAWTPRGRRLVALGGEAAVVELDRRRRHRVGPAPRGLALGRGRFFTVSALTGAVAGGRA